MPDENDLVKFNTHIPRTCEKCGKSDPEYQGVGEYKCRDCGFIMYDDYGRVRNYLEAHRGATQSQVANATGVSMEVIRQLLREERIEIVSTSNVFMECEICKTPIRSGRYCMACAKKVAAKEEAVKAELHKAGMKGFGKGLAGESGSIRYRR